MTRLQIVRLQRLGGLTEAQARLLAPHVYGERRAPENRAEARLGREGDRWHVYVRRGAEGATQALWLSLGGCGDHRTAIRVWLALLGGSDGR